MKQAPYFLLYLLLLSAPTQAPQSQANIDEELYAAVKNKKKSDVIALLEAKANPQKKITEYHDCVPLAEFSHNQVYFPPTSTSALLQARKFARKGDKSILDLLVKK